MKSTYTNCIALALLAGVSIGAAATPAASATGAAAPAASPIIKIKPYLLDTCIVTGDKIGSMGAAPVIIQDGHEVKFCCGDCPADFAKDPAKYMKMIADAEKKLPAPKVPAKEAPIKPYPLDVCVIMDKKLGSMGAPVIIQYNGQEIKLCCKECLPSFNKDPLGVWQKIAAAQTKTAAPSTTAKSP